MVFTCPLGLSGLALTEAAGNKKQLRHLGEMRCASVVECTVVFDGFTNSPTA